jgi:hypothetical protein
MVTEGHILNIAVPSGVTSCRHLEILRWAGNVARMVEVRKLFTARIDTKDKLEFVGVKHRMLLD